MSRVILGTVILMASMAAAAPPAPYGAMPDGTQVEQFTLTNKHGMVAKLISYGGTLTELQVPDKDGRLVDVVLGFDKLDDYRTKSPYFGCIAGRYANRIAKGRFTLDGKEYKVATNNGPNHLHGGVHGFDKVVWKAEPTGRELRFNYTSPDGEEGYPGNLRVSVAYSLDENNTLWVIYDASTDKPTPINLTNHSYFNLSGQASGDVLGHELWLDASRYTPVDATSIPTGEIAPVAGTPFDFTKPKLIGADIQSLTNTPRGYDHNFVFDKKDGKVPVRARLRDPKSGRVMEVRTNQPGVQFYTGNYLDGTIKGKGGVVYKQYQGLCLECQHFPDSPNRPNFPTTILRPGEKYTQVTGYHFSSE